MTKATFKSVNAAIAEQGKRAELIKGGGYFYFAGDDVSVDAPSVYVYRLSDLTLEQWLEHFAQCVQLAPATNA